METCFVIAGFVLPGAEIGEWHKLISPVAVKVTRVQEDMLKAYPATHEPFNLEVYRRLAASNRAFVEQNTGRDFAFVYQTAGIAKEFKSVLDALGSSADSLSLDLTDFEVLKSN